MNAKDVTATSFGLIIAFLLPGLMAVATVAFWNKDVHGMLTTFLTSEANVGLFLLVIMVSLIAGLEISAIRAGIIRITRSSAPSLAHSGFSGLADEARLSAFSAATDQHYRYHQFWGGTALVLPFTYIGLLQTLRGGILSCVALSLAFVIMEAATIFASVDEHRCYVERSKEILKTGGSHGHKRLGQSGSQEGASEESGGQKDSSKEEHSGQEDGSQENGGEEDSSQENGS